MDANGKILEIVPAQGVRQVSPPIVHIRIDCGMSVFVDRTLFREVAGIPKARGRQDVARGMFVGTSRDRQQLTVFYLKSENRFHWNYGGGEGREGGMGDLM